MLLYSEEFEKGTPFSLAIDNHVNEAVIHVNFAHSFIADSITVNGFAKKTLFSRNIFIRTNT